jgi:hypothetical protein
MKMLMHLLNKGVNQEPLECLSVTFLTYVYSFKSSIFKMLLLSTHVSLYNYVTQTYFTQYVSPVALFAVGV